MSNILSAGTRVTVIYRGEKCQGSVLADSTKETARVQILGRVGLPKVSYRWSEVRKNEYRCFKIADSGDMVTITEIEPKNLHPMNWMGFGEASREGAWAFAQARGKRTVFIDRDGVRTELGQVFDPRAFERSAYQGYVAYGCSMTDGYYAPEKFESWVKGLRKDPKGTLSYHNDVDESVKAALPLYQAALASLSR